MIILSLLQVDVIGHADSYAGEMISGIVSREPRGYSCFGDVNRAGNLWTWG